MGKVAAAFGSSAYDAAVLDLAQQPFACTQCPLRFTSAKVTLVSLKYPMQKETEQALRSFEHMNQHMATHDAGTPSPALVDLDSPEASPKATNGTTAHAALQPNGPLPRLSPLWPSRGVYARSRCPP